MTRKWFQIHLSTAIIMSLMLSVFMCLNLRLTSNNYSDPQNAGYYLRGFPYRMNDTRKGWHTSFSFVKPDNILYSGRSRASRPDGLEGNWYVLPMLLNACAAVLICGVVGVMSESLIRRCEAPQP
jgi:hypothetical protein